MMSCKANTAVLYFIGMQLKHHQKRLFCHKKTMVFSSKKLFCHKFIHLPSKNIFHPLNIFSSQNEMILPHKKSKFRQKNLPGNKFD